MLPFNPNSSICSYVSLYFTIITCLYFMKRSMCNLHFTVNTNTSHVSPNTTTTLFTEYLQQTGPLQTIQAIAIYWFNILHSIQSNAINQSIATNRPIANYLPVFSDTWNQRHRSYHHCWLDCTAFCNRTHLFWFVTSIEYISVNSIHFHRSYHHRRLDCSAIALALYRSVTTIEYFSVNSIHFHR